MARARPIEAPGDVLEALLDALRTPEPGRHVARVVAEALGARELALLVAEPDGHALLVAGAAGERLGPAAGRRVAVPPDLAGTDALARHVGERLAPDVEFVALPLCPAPFCLALADVPRDSAVSALAARIGRSIALVLEESRVAGAAALDRRRAEAVRDVSEAIAQSLDPAHVWQTFTSRLERHLPFDFAALGSVETDPRGRQTVHFVYTSPSASTPGGFAVSPGDLFARALAGGQAASAPDLRLSRHRTDLELHAQGLACACAVPLVARAAVEGVVLLGRQAGRPIAQDELLLFTQAAAHLGPALANARAYRDLAALHARLDEESRARETLASLLIHDLRTPLTVVLTNLEYFEIVHSDDREAREALVGSRASLTTMVELVTSLLDLSHLEHAHLKCVRRPIRLPELVEPALAQVRPLARGRSISLVTDCAEATLEIDDTLAARALRNLLSAAVRRTQAGGEVRLLVEARGGFRAEVHEGAPALPPDQREDAFRKFAPQAGQLGLVAHGLGLHYARLAAEAHGGRAYAGEGPGGAGLLVLELPAARTG